MKITLYRMKKGEWLVGMTVVVATFMLTGCANKENRQKMTAPVTEDTTVGICPCCEAELAEMEDSDTTTIVDFVDGI